MGGLTALRVLVVADVWPAVVVGGSERVIWEQARRLAARGHRVRIVARAPAEGGAEVVDREGVAVRPYAASRHPAWRFVWASILGARRAAAAEVRGHGADVLHLHQPLSAFGVLTDPALRKLPTVYTFHSPAALEYRGRRGTTDWHRGGLAGRAGAALLRRLERWTLARVGRIHVLSDYSAELLRTLYGLDDDRLEKIDGGADTSRLRPADAPRAALRAELGWPAEGPVLFTLRNLEPRMGLDELIRAIALLRDRGSRVWLAIGGEGALRGDLEALVGRLGLAGQVRFLGFVEEARLARCYQASDAFVLPTQSLEGFGLVTVEALACGTPVLGTPVGATPEILGPLSKALVFGGTSAAAMADDLGRFLDEPAPDAGGVEALRRACRSHAESRYDWEHHVGRLETMLAGLALSRECRCVCGASLDPPRALAGRAFRRCPACGTRRRAVMPDQARVRVVYDVEYPRRFPHVRVSGTRADLFASIASRLSALRRPGRLLDVGGGGGQFAAAAAGLGWRGLAADLSYEACLAARAGGGGAVVQGDAARLPIREAAVDAVSLVNVVDHTVDPGAVIAEARRAVAPGGVIVIRVTNAWFHVATARGLSWAPWLGRAIRLGPVFHLWSFTPRGLRALVARAGLEVVAAANSSPVATPGDARWVTVLASLVHGATAVAAAASGGRWLLAPAVELWARRPEGRRT
jgi:glycosyltransferase involved in cell wall biosynthesis/SAM-dependent methyltransferase